MFPFIMLPPCARTTLADRIKNVATAALVNGFIKAPYDSVGSEHEHQDYLTKPTASVRGRTDAKSQSFTSIRASPHRYPDTVKTRFISLDFLMV
jgi:hypothetical protein